MDVKFIKVKHFAESVFQPFLGNLALQCRLGQ